MPGPASGGSGFCGGGLGASSLGGGLGSLSSGGGLSDPVWFLPSWFVATSEPCGESPPPLRVAKKMPTAGRTSATTAAATQHQTRLLPFLGRGRAAEAGSPKSQSLPGADETAVSTTSCA